MNQEESNQSESEQIQIQESSNDLTFQQKIEQLKQNNREQKKRLDAKQISQQNQIFSDSTFKNPYITDQTRPQSVSDPLSFTIPTSQLSPSSAANSTLASSQSGGQNNEILEESKVEEQILQNLKMQQNNISVKGYVDNQKYLRVSVSAKDVEECPPTDLFCCVDVSGSMGWSCAGKTDGRTEYVENGFSLLDLVRHALKTVIKTMRPQDRLCLMTFNNSTKVIMDYTQMDEQGQFQAEVTAQIIKASGGTNIQLALTDAINYVCDRKDTTRNPSILFFTDGQSNVSLQPLQDLKDQKEFNCPIHTFGFGQYTNLNSLVLYDIAKIFSGYNAYIPDPTNLGTTFVNGIANILTTAAIGVKLNLGKAIKQFIEPQISIGDLPLNDKGEIMLGQVRFGQSIDILISQRGNKNQKLDQDLAKKFLSQINVTYEVNGHKFQEFMQKEVIVCNLEDNLQHELRFKTIETMLKILKAFNSENCQQESVNILQKHILKYKNLDLQDNCSKGIIANLEDQLTLALGKYKYFQKWGNHQYRQLLRSINIQAKNNFRDPAVAHFGGQLFEDFSDEADDIYNNLPPPKATLIAEKPKAQVIDTAEQFAEIYNNVNSGCGCFSGDSSILMANKSKKQVQDLIKGDLVETLNGTAKIVCVVKTQKSQGTAELCTLPGGLKITQHHPILHNGQWIYPGDIQKPKSMSCDFVYNLVIDSDHVVIINGVPLILLGHNYNHGILMHPYLGSQKVIDDLKEMPGWRQGLVQLRDGCMLKNTKFECKLVYNGPKCHEVFQESF